MNPGSGAPELTLLTIRLNCLSINVFEMSEKG